MADEDADAPPRQASGSMFRAAAVSRYMEGAETPDAAPIVRPRALRWLWVALAVTLAAVAWVALRPVPAFEDTPLALLDHACDGLSGEVVMVVDAAAEVPLGRGRRVIVDDAQGARHRLRVTQDGHGPLDPSDITDRLGCEVDVSPLPSEGRYGVGVADVEEGQAGGAVDAPVITVAHVEVASRPLGSLLPVWTSPAGEATAPDDAPAAGSSP